MDNRLPVKVDIPDSPRRRDTAKEAVTDFGNETTIHGLQYVLNGTHIIYRVCWLAICIGFFVIFVIQGISIFKHFIGYPTSTTIEIVSRPKLTFPAVTVCNANKMRRSRLVDTRFQDLIDIDGGVSGSDSDYSWWFSSGFWAGYNTSYWSSSPSASSGGIGRRKRRSAEPERRKRLADIAMEVTNLGKKRNARKISDAAPESQRRNHPQTQPRYRRNGPYSSEPSSSGQQSSSPSFDFSFYEYGWGSITDANDWQGLYENSQADDFSDFIEAVNPTTAELSQYGHQLSDFILQCTFDRQPCGNISTKFAVWQSKYYGNCFTFNSEPAQNTTISTGLTGQRNGLHLTLFVEQPEYVGILAPHTGARVSIHHPDVYPFPEDDAVSIPTGEETSIGVRQEYIQRLGGRYGNCTANGANTNFTSDTYAYSLTACKKLCYQRHLLDKCKCVDDVFFEAVSERCSVINATQQYCRQRVESLYLDERLECKCPSPCAETKYITSPSSMLWPSERYEEHLLTKIQNAKALRLLGNPETTRKNFIRLKVYYEELNYEHVSEVAVYTIPSLLGSIGGLMGLYIGMSFISLFEVLFLLLRLGKLILRKMFCKNDIQPTIA